MERQDARQKKNGETRCKMKKKWGDEIRDRKKMGRQDARQKNWEMRRKTKKWGTDARQKKMGRQDKTRDKKKLGDKM